MSDHHLRTCQITKSAENHVDFPRPYIHYMVTVQCRCRNAALAMEFELWFEFHGERGARDYNGGLGAEPPAGVQGAQPPVRGQGSEALLKLNAFLFLRVQRKLQIYPIIDICKSQ